MSAFATWLIFVLVIVGAVGLGVGIESWLSPRWGVVARIIGLSVTLILAFVVATVLHVPSA